MRGRALQGAFAHFCVGIKVGRIVKKAFPRGEGGRRSLTDEVIYEGVQQTIDEQCTGFAQKYDKGRETSLV